MTGDVTFGSPHDLIAMRVAGVVTVVTSRPPCEVCFAALAVVQCDTIHGCPAQLCPTCWPRHAADQRIGAGSALMVQKPALYDEPLARLAQLRDLELLAWWRAWNTPVEEFPL
jgi:hypothetical protein